MRFLLVALLPVYIFSCAPARKAIYFNNLQPGSDSLQITLLEAAKQIQAGDRLSIQIVVQDIQGMQLLNSGQGMGLGMGMGGGNVGGGGQGGGFLGYLVDRQGEVELPLIGKFSVAGSTPDQVRELVKSKVGVLYKEPVVYCQLSGRVVVLGDAGITGSVPLQNDRLTILEALSTSGVVDPTAHRDKIWLIRETNGSRSYTQLNLNDRSIFRSPYFYLRNNDVLYVPPGKLPSFLKVNAPYLSAFSIGTGLLGILISVIALTR